MTTLDPMRIATLLGAYLEILGCDPGPMITAAIAQELRWDGEPLRASAHAWFSRPKP